MINTLKRFLIVATLLACITACQKAEPVSTNANTAPANVSTATSSPVPGATQENVNATTPDSPVTVSFATPTDAYKTGYTARKNKDIALLKRVFAKDALAFITEMAQAENKTLDDELKDLADKPQAPTAETRNEKINGNRASLEYLDEKGNWSSMDFSKEGNDWKIDLPKGP